MIASIEASDLITVHLNSTVARTAGAPGRFSVDIATESGAVNTETFGAIIQATGFKLYDPSNLPQYGYSKSPDIVTNAELEKLVKDANGGASNARPTAKRSRRSPLYRTSARVPAKRGNSLITPVSVI